MHVYVREAAADLPAATKQQTNAFIPLQVRLRSHSLGQLLAGKEREMKTCQ